MPDNGRHSAATMRADQPCAKCAVEVKLHWPTILARTQVRPQLEVL
jgi:hypothetical protein